MTRRLHCIHRGNGTIRVPPRNAAFRGGSRGRAGLTLLEVLLTVALLSIFAGISLSVLYWQARIYTAVVERSDAMARFADTHIAMLKIIRPWSRAKIAMGANSLTHDATTELRFDPAARAVLLNSKALLEQVATASFFWDTSPTASGLVRVFMQSTGADPVALRIVIHPRNP